MKKRLSKLLLMIFATMVLCSCVGTGSAGVADEDYESVHEDSYAEREEEISEDEPEEKQTEREMDDEKDYNLEEESPTAGTMVNAEDPADHTLEEEKRTTEVYEDDFWIEGSWKSIGEYGFGQAQPGAIVAFDGTHCNFFSPYDTYVFYKEDGEYQLDCTSMLFSDTLNFMVEIIDENNINIYSDSAVTELKRVK